MRNSPNWLESCRFTPPLLGTAKGDTNFREKGAGILKCIELTYDDVVKCSRFYKIWAANWRSTCESGNLVTYICHRFVNSRMNLWLLRSYKAVSTGPADFKKPLAAYSTNKKNRLQGLQDWTYRGLATSYKKKSATIIHHSYRLANVRVGSGRHL
jgi:hypothetical protein